MYGLFTYIYPRNQTHVGKKMPYMDPMRVITGSFKPNLNHPSPIRVLHSGPGRDFFVSNTHVTFRSTCKALATDFFISWFLASLIHFVYPGNSMHMVYLPTIWGSLKV